MERPDNVEEVVEATCRSSLCTLTLSPQVGARCPRGHPAQECRMGWVGKREAAGILDGEPETSTCSSGERLRGRPVPVTAYRRRTRDRPPSGRGSRNSPRSTTRSGSRLPPPGFSGPVPARWSPPARMPTEHVPTRPVECSSRIASTERDEGRSVASIVVAFADKLRPRGFDPRFTFTYVRLASTSHRGKWSDDGRR